MKVGLVAGQIITERWSATEGAFDEENGSACTVTLSHTPPTLAGYVIGLAVFSAIHYFSHVI